MFWQLEKRSLEGVAFIDYIYMDISGVFVLFPGTQAHSVSNRPDNFFKALLLYASCFFCAPETARFKQLDSTAEPLRHNMLAGQR